MRGQFYVTRSNKTLDIGILDYSYTDVDQEVLDSYLKRNGYTIIGIMHFKVGDIVMIEYGNISAFPHPPIAHHCLGYIEQVNYGELHYLVNVMGVGLFTFADQYLVPTNIEVKR